MEGRIIKGIGGFYYIKTSDKTIYECKARGKFRKDGITPTVGDVVETDGKSIDKIYERKSMLVRPSVANIDNLIIVIAAKNPSPDLFLVDKLTVSAECAGIEPVICINKSDLSDCDEILSIYKNIGYKVFVMSAKEKTGAEELRTVMYKKISAFAGLSGVGKSSIINLLCDDSVETGETSRINRGRHTTRHVELFEVDDDSYILDTPGFSSLEISQICDIDASKLWQYFPEFQTDTPCRFKGCSHITEPDCAVLDKLSRGSISKSRYESYVKLYEQLKNKKEW